MYGSSEVKPLFKLIEPQALSNTLTVSPCVRFRTMNFIAIDSVFLEQRIPFTIP